MDSENNSAASEPIQSDGVSSEPVTQMESQVAGTDGAAELESPRLGEDQKIPESSQTEGSQDEPDWFQKRINKLTAKNKAGEETIEELKQQLAELKKQVAPESQSEQKQEPTIEQLRAELARAANEGDWEYHAQVSEYMAELKARNEKDAFLSKSKEAEEQAQKQAQEWAMIVDEYGKYGLSDQNSQIYQLAKAHYMNSPEYGQYAAVARAYRELSEKGLLRSDNSVSAEQSLQKERMKSQLGAGVNAASQVSTSKKPVDYEKEAIRERIQFAAKARGLA